MFRPCKSLDWLLAPSLTTKLIFFVIISDNNIDPQPGHAHTGAPIDRHQVARFSDVRKVCTSLLEIANSLVYREVASFGCMRAWQVSDQSNCRV